jgi:hypothetical protein
MMFLASTRKFWFKIFALLFLMASAYHLIGIFYPLDTSPIWRHSIFVAINLCCSVLVLKRPKYFFYIAIVLSMQQYYSHGSYFLKLLKEEGKIHWLSIGVFILLPILLLLLWEDYKKNDQVNGHS